MCLLGIVGSGRERRAATTGNLRGHPAGVEMGGAGAKEAVPTDGQGFSLVTSGRSGEEWFSASTQKGGVMRAMQLRSSARLSAVVAATMSAMLLGCSGSDGLPRE